MPDPAVAPRPARPGGTPGPADPVQPDGWAAWAGHFADHGADAYARIAAAVLAEPSLVPEGHPLVVLHAVRRAAIAGRARDPWLGDPSAFGEDIARRNDEVTRAAARGLVQFTEPLRMADVLPGLLIAATWYPGRPVRLVEIGSSAGLLLLPEAYRIAYPTGRWEPDGAAVDLRSDLAVPAGLLDVPLRIDDRIGIDLAPVDPADPGTYDYLRSFAWPGSPDREPRLARALAEAARRPVPAVAGDVLDVLPDVLAARVGSEAVTVVIDSAMSGYLPSSTALRLGRLLDDVAARGPLLLVVRGPADGGDPDLPATVRLVDLRARRRLVYAAGDLLSERTRWLADPQGIRASLR